MGLHGCEAAGGGGAQGAGAREASGCGMAICAANASMEHNGRKNYCGNLLWQSCQTLLVSSIWRSIHRNQCETEPRGEGERN